MVDADSGSSDSATLSHRSAMIDHMFDNMVAAKWSARSYEVNGVDEADIISACDIGFPSISAFIVTVPSISHMDVVVTEIDELEDADEFFTAQAASGWNVCALVPLPLLAAAHNACRGQPTFLQGWWEPRPGELAFTTPEVP